MQIPAITEMFDLSQTDHADVFHDAEHPWEALSLIEEYLHYFFEHNTAADHSSKNESASIGDNVYIGEGTTIEPGAVIHGPAIIGKNCEIRSGAYLRKNVIVGDKCVVGNSTEVKNSMLFNHVSAPHYNYIGDSILGYKAHLGSGVVLSNIKTPASEIKIRTYDRSYKTGLLKFGALIGDFSEVGSNSVLNPGTIIGRNSTLYPLTSFRGILPQNSIVKTRQEQEIVPKK